MYSEMHHHMDKIDYYELIRQHFGFLVNEYNFHKKDNIFTNDRIEITINFGRFQPTAEIKRIDEPERSIIALNWFFSYYIDNFDFSAFHNVDIDVSTERYAAIFRKYSEIIINQIDEWWLPVQKYILEDLGGLFGRDAEILQDLTEYIEKHEKRSQEEST